MRTDVLRIELLFTFPVDSLVAVTALAADLHPNLSGAVGACRGHSERLVLKYVIRGSENRGQIAVNAGCIVSTEVYFREGNSVRSLTTLIYLI